MVEDIALHYFNLFSHKDINALNDLFADYITLRDWEIDAKGKTEVLQANKVIFESVTNIEVQPVKLYSAGHTVIAELRILVNGIEEELVVDILEFDTDLKIKAIRAYKGN
ncbi:MAG: hypothetical protein CBC19_10385 [Oceanospirillales bacterium TMED59]|nr:MAG: hypothetical protein CBC19_10385 [Oceanospirillales bacterium TMED59]|tara:strand:+ start:3174 stop:3503 length:330 start_codon:yes stop_codon:yes gene_type:complete